MTKHTPGPWHSGTVPHIVYDMGGWAVCNTITYHGKHEKGEDEANARLIAAAPDLLAALHDAAALLEVYTNTTGRNGPNVTTHGQALATIREGRAAIAKATQ